MADIMPGQDMSAAGGNRMRRDAVRQLQMLRVGALPPYTTDGDDDGSKSVEAYLAFYDAQDPDNVRATVERYMQALESYRTSGCLDAALDELLQAQREFIQVIPFAGDSLPRELTPPDRSYVANLFRKALDDGGYIVDQRLLQELILRLVERSDSSG
jgi:hypothetical protein